MNHLSQQKPNGLKGYDYSQNAAYFITICVKDREELLGKIVGDGVLDVPKIKLSDYGKVVDQHIQNINRTYDHLDIIKYVIMPKHLHMIIFLHGDQKTNLENETSRTLAPTNAVIPKVISTLKRFVNHEIGFSLFQRSYHDHIIRNEEEYKKIWGYIDTNTFIWKEDCFFKH